MPATRDPLHGLQVQASLLFNGTGDYVSFDQPIIPASGSFSVAVIFYAPRSLSGICELVSQPAGYGTNFYLGRGPYGQFRAGDDWGRLGADFPADDAWHTMVLTRGPQDTWLFLDEQKVEHCSMPIGNPTGGEFRIGRQFGNNEEYFRGQIAEVAVWSRALTDGEAMMYPMGWLSGNEPDLRALIRFDTPGFVFDRMSGALGRMFGCTHKTAEPPPGEAPRRIAQQRAAEGALQAVRSAAAARREAIHPGQTIELWSELTGAPMWVRIGTVDWLQQRVLASPDVVEPQRAQWVLQRCSGDTGPIRYGEFINLLCPCPGVQALLRVRRIDRGVQAMVGDVLNLPVVNNGQEPFAQFRLVDPSDRARSSPIEDGAPVLIESCFDPKFENPVRFLRPTVTSSTVWVECQPLELPEKHTFRVRLVRGAGDRTIRTGANVRLRSISENKTLSVNTPANSWVVPSREGGMAARWHIETVLGRGGEPVAPWAPLRLRSLDARVSAYLNCNGGSEVTASGSYGDVYRAFGLFRPSGSMTDPLVDGDIVAIKGLFDEKDASSFLAVIRSPGVVRLERTRQLSNSAEQQFRIELDDDAPPPPSFTAALAEAQRLLAERTRELEVALAQDTAAGGAGEVALQLNGSDAYASFDRALIPASGPFTLAVTFCATPQADGNGELISQDGGSGGTACYLGRAWAGYLRAGDGWENTGIAFPQDGAWHTLVLVRRDSETVLYQDGQQVAQLPRAIANPAGSEFRIGRQYGGYSEYFNGRIAEIAVWGRALDAAQVQAYRVGSLSGSEAELRALVRLDTPGQILDRVSSVKARGVNVSWWRAGASDARFLALAPRPLQSCTSVVQLSGSDAYVSFGCGLIPASGPFTVAITFSAAPQSGSNAELISQDGGSGSGFYLGRSWAGYIRAGDSWENTGTRFPQDSGWHTLVLVRGTNETRLYQDGQQVAQLPRAIGNPAGSEFRIGRQFGDHAEYFGGRIAEVAVWGEALDATRAQTYAAGVLQGAEAGLRGLMRFDVPGQLIDRVSGAQGRGYGLAWSDLAGSMIPWFVPTPAPLGTVALKLNGSDACASLGCGLIPASGPFTVAITFSAAPQSGSNAELISQDGGSGSGFYLGRSWAGYIRAGDSWENTGATFPQDSGWHTLILVRGTNETRLYQDGQQVAQLPRAIGNPAGSEFRIGRQFGDYAEYFGGRVAEVAVWGEALDAAQVQAHRPGALFGAEAGLRALLRFDTPGQLVERVSGTLAKSNSAAWWRAGAGETPWTAPPADSGAALLLNGRDGYVAFERALVPASGPFTLAVAFCASSQQSGNRELISQDGGDGTALYLGCVADGQMRAGDGWSVVPGARFPADDAWHTLVLARSDSDTVLYLDGAVAGRLGRPIANPRGREFRIGRQYGGHAEYFGGKIAEVAIFAEAHGPERAAAYAPGRLRGDEPRLRSLVRCDSSGPILDRVGGAVGRTFGGCTFVPAQPGIPDWRHARSPVGLCVRPAPESGLWRQPQQRLCIEQRLRLRQLPAERLTLLQRGYAPNPDLVLSVDKAGSLRLTLRGSDGNTATLDTAAGLFPAGRFVAVAVRIDLATAQAQLLLDGVVAAEQRLVRPASGDLPELRWRGLQATADGSLWLGRGPESGSPDIELHEARAWERLPDELLGPPALLALTGREPGLLGWWRWRDLRDGAVPDASGRNQTATAG